MTRGIYYVYEHWRPDLNACFYVGKGKGSRANKFSRNSDYNAIARDVERRELTIEVRIVAQRLSETAALNIEVERIAFWRRAAVALTNRTDGGEGFSGFKRPTGIRQTEESRRKLSLARKGIVFTIEHKAKLAARKRGVKRRPFTTQTIARMREAAARREALKREIHGSAVTRWSTCR